MVITFLRRAAVFCLLSGALAALGPLRCHAAPQLRQWLLVGGEKIYADLVEVKPGNIVVLCPPDGVNKEVPLSSLSKVDQNFVRRNMQKSSAGPTVGSNSAGAGNSRGGALDKASDPKNSEDATGDALGKIAGSSADPADQLRSLKNQAQHSDTPEVAILLFDVFLNSKDLPTDVRSEAEAERAEWQDKAKRGLVRFGSKWLTVSEVRGERAKAHYLVANSLELIRLNQGQLALEKLQDASRTDPECIQADFIMATIFAIFDMQFDKAYQHYKVCLKRDPTNIAVLNNLALVEIKRANFSEAVTLWKNAARQRYDDRMLHNMGRMMDQAGKRKLAVNKETIDRLNRVYADLVIANRLAGAVPAQGWMYMMIAAELPPDATVSATGAVDDSGEPIVAAKASGFVPYKNYVLTHRDLAKHAREFKVASPSEEGRTLGAKLVGVSDIYDLALLECEGLDRPPLPLDSRLPSVETPVTVAGFQPTAGLSAPPEFVHGAVVAQPQSSLDRLVVYNVEGTFASVGGPVVDKTGNVVAMHDKNLSVLARSYGGGVPTAAAELFLRGKIPGYRAAERGSESISRTEIESRVKDASVIVMAIARAQDAGLAKRVGPEFCEDCSCCRCRGFGKQDCLVRECKGGRVPHTETEVVGRNTATGELLYQQYNKPIPCAACKGEGRIPCQECNGSGIDPELRLRSAARLHALGGSAGNGIIGVLGSPGLLPGGR